jgi:hypothetical protein
MKAEGRKPSGPNGADCEIHQPAKPNMPDGLRRSATIKAGSIRFSNRCGEAGRGFGIALELSPRKSSFPQNFHALRPNGVFSNPPANVCFIDFLLLILSLESW